MPFLSNDNQQADQREQYIAPEKQRRRNLDTAVPSRTLAKEYII